CTGNDGLAICHGTASLFGMLGSGGRLIGETIAVAPDEAAMRRWEMAGHDQRSGPARLVEKAQARRPGLMRKNAECRIPGRIEYLRRMVEDIGGENARLALRVDPVIQLARRVPDGISHPQAIGHLCLPVDEVGKAG